LGVVTFGGSGPFGISSPSSGEFFSSAMFLDNNNIQVKWLFNEEWSFSFGGGV
jgi:hypothetical protein